MQSTQIVAQGVVGATEGFVEAVAQAQETYDFDIPSQPLPQAMAEFSAVTGLQVLYTETSPFEITAPALRGSLTADQALRQLLANTGLDYRLTAGDTVTLERVVVDESSPLRMDPITVDAVLAGTLTDSYAAPDNFAATRTDTPVIDTPQSTQAVTRQALDDAGAKEISDAYDYLAGINRETNLGGLFGDAYIARGFTTDNILVNGNRSGRPTTLDTANVERVEAIRGPTGTLFGRADPGGLVNVVTKQPLAQAFYQAELEGGSGFFGDGSRYRDVRATVDTGGPVDELGRIRYRFNAAAEYERSFRQDVDETLVFVSPVVDFELDDQTIANLEFTYQYRREVFDRGVFFIDDDLDLPPDWYVGEDQAPDLDSHFASGTFRIDHELTDAVTARLGFYASYSDIEGEGIEQTGVTGSQASALLLDNDVSELFLTAQPELVAEVETGPIGHTLLFGFDAAFQRSRFGVARGAPGTPFDAFDPDFPVDVPEIDLSLLQNTRFDSNFEARSLGVYLEDQIDLSDQWKLLIGGRWDFVWLNSKNRTSFNVGTVVTDERDEDFKDNAFLPRVGIVYQPIKEVGLYASYSESYRAPPASSSLRDGNGEQVDPEEGRSLEVGIKLEALDGRLNGTLAAFRADKKNVLEADPLDPFAQTNLGRVRSQGVEFDVAGEVIENVSLSATYAYSDARINSNDASIPKGTRLRNVPRHAVSFQAAYRFTTGPLQGLRLFGGAVYEDQKPSETAGDSPPKLPDYLRFDLGASYQFTENIEANLLIRNLTDTEYYTSAATSERIAVGQPFNATFGVRLRF